MDIKLRNLRTRLEVAQQKMKTAADKHRTYKNFNIGDLVLDKLQPYRQTTVAFRPSHKLSKHYFGPFPIISKIGNVAYKLQLPEPSKIHPVFHVSLLKEFHGSSTECSDFFPSNSYNNQPLFRPSAIISTRKQLIQNTWVPQSLIQWERLPLEEATWINDSDIHSLLPDVHLEDKVFVEEEGIVTEGDEHAKVVEQK